jgi:hypothetical protein
MKKKIKLLLSTLIIPLFSACRVQTPVEYEGFISSTPLSQLLNLRLSDILMDNRFLYLVSPISGTLLFCLGIILLFLRKKDKSSLYLALSSLIAALVYTLPFWVDMVNLPREFWSAQMIRTVFLLLFYKTYRSWCRKALYHRTKVWSFLLSSMLLSIALIGTLLSGHFPQILNLQWPVPILASVLILDSVINSILSFQRKDDRSGIAGVLTLVPLIGLSLWLYYTRRYTGLFPFLNNLYFALPSLLILWQFALTVGLIQRRYNKEEQRNSILRKMVEDEEIQKDKLEEMIENLEARYEEETRIPDYSLECSRRLLEQKGDPALSLPGSWSGAHRLIADSHQWPMLGVWNSGKALLFAENLGKESLVPLLYLQEIFKNLKIEKPAQMMKLLNDRMCSLHQNMETGLSAVYLYYLDDELICGTAGRVRIYMQKNDGKIVPVQTQNKPVTFKEGLGVRAQTREDGKPYRIPLEKGDRIILVSSSLTDRELGVSGELYGQKSLYRVLRSHESASPENTVLAILKDFDDFDLGNTLDRQIYAAVFQKT